LFDELMGEFKGKSKEQIAGFWNGATDVMGNYLLHVCAQYGSCEDIAVLLTPLCFK